MLVFLAEPFAFSGITPLVDRLSPESRTDLYGQIVPVSASLLGFYIAAVAILASLDARRQIVQELKTGKEAFRLLIINMLAAIAFLLALTLLGVAGSVLDPGSPFSAIYEWVALTTLFELVLSGFYFGVVTYKVAADTRVD